MKTVGINLKVCERRDDTIPVNRKGNTCQMLILDNEGWNFYWEFSDADSIEDVQ